MYCYQLTFEVNVAKQSSRSVRISGVAQNHDLAIQAARFNILKKIEDDIGVEEQHVKLSLTKLKRVGEKMF